MNNAPAYQMYAGDWIKHRSVRLMEDYQRGWYIQLLNEAWDGSPQCMLPNNDAMLQKLACVSELARSQRDFNDRWKAVRSMFNVDGEYVYNERQLEELAGQKQRRQAAIKAGNASAKAREKKRKELQLLKRKHLNDGNGRSTDAQREGNEKPTLQSSTAPSSSGYTSPPIPPKGGQQKKRKKRLTVAEKKRMKVEVNSDTMRRIGRWFGRNPDTLWSRYEAEALDQLSPIDPSELDLLESYYMPADGNKEYRRKDVGTLLNNWTGELDRASAWTPARSMNHEDRL